MSTSTIVTRIIQSFLCGLLVMWGFKYLHHDVSSVPPIGYWASFFSSAALIAVGHAINGRDEPK